MPERLSPDQLVVGVGDRNVINFTGDGVDAGERVGGPRR